MTAFAADVAAIFDDVLAVDANYLSQGLPPAVAVRVIPKRGDQISEFAQSSVVQSGFSLKAQVAQIADPMIGDIFVINGERYAVQGAPVRNARRTLWSIEVHPECA